jgi:hypothetical protein
LFHSKFPFLSRLRSFIALSSRLNYSPTGIFGLSNLMSHMSSTAFAQAQPRLRLKSLQAQDNYPLIGGQVGHRSHGSAGPSVLGVLRLFSCVHVSLRSILALPVLEPGSRSLQMLVQRATEESQRQPLVRARFAHFQTHRF